jgi:hypothetical protein
MNGQAALTVAAAAGYELRAIVVAQGIQFNTDLPKGYLQDQLGADLVLNPSGVWTYRSDKQRVIYSLRVVNTKAEFKTALEGSKKLHVIYDGHSRYGRGCCFGTSDAPGEDWENGTDPAKTGLYRMGMPYVAIPVSDVAHHQYTLDVVPSSEQLTPADCEKDLHDDLGVVGRHSLADITAASRGSLRINKRPLTSSDRFWGFQWPGEGFSVVTHAGWAGTASSPMDLGATNIGSRVFCHFGCSSFQHYHHVVRDLKNWKKVGSTDQFAYFTSDIAYGMTTSFWLHRLFTYDQYNASWEPSLEYARKNANQDLKSWCHSNGVRVYEIW